MIELKRDWSCERLLALARNEGLPSTRARRFGCPARCSDAGDTVAVSETSNGAMWNCHRCGIGGSVIDLLQRTRGLDVTGALRELEQLSNVVPMRPPAPARETPDAGPLWEKLALTDQAGLEYLRGRGLDGAPAVRFNTGTSGNRWLDLRARDGYRLALALFSVDGTIVSLQLRSVVVGVPAKEAKRSLAGVTYPKEGVAMGDVGRARIAERVHLAEGIADTLALQLVGVVVIGAPGVDQLKRLLNFLGDVNGREVVLCPQNDSHEKSQQAFASLAGKLADAGAHVLELATPAPHKDPADWLKAVGREAFAAAVRAEPRARVISREPGSDDDEEAPAEVVQLDTGLPEIRITVQEHLVNDQAAAALARDKLTYQRAGALVYVVRSPESAKSALKRAPDSPRIRLMPTSVLRERLTAVARWVKFNKSEHAWMPAHPPDWCVPAVHARGDWPEVRPLAGVTEIPVLRPDGSILEQPGYDEATELLFEPNDAFLPIAESPTRTDALEQLELLNELFCDFPFESPAHYSAALALLFTPFARHAFAGSVPLGAIDANTRGAGKSLLADLVGIVATGRPLARMANTRDDEEMRKRMISIALGGDPIVLIDNVVGTLGCASLNLAITGEVIKDRLMATNDAPSIRMATQFFATGNNLVLDGDTTRRTLHIRITTPFERPEEREGFRHGGSEEVKAWAKKRRPELVRAVLTILRAYAVVGKPDQNLKPWGSFDGWSRLIRHTLVWLGLPDPGLTREELAEMADTEASLLGQLLAGWEELDPMRGGYTVQQMRERLESEPHHLKTLRDAIEELAPSAGGKPASNKTIGRRLMHFRGRLHGGLSLVAEKDRLSILTWKVEKAVNPASNLLNPASENKDLHGLNGNAGFVQELNGENR